MRERMLFPSLIMVTVITALIAGLGTPLLPQIVQHYQISLQDAQWVLTLPMLVGAVVSPLIGRLGGPGRQRRLLIVSLVIVAVGLLLSVLPLGFFALLLGRALQGVGLALTPIVLSLARDILGAERALPMIANLTVANVASNGLAYPLSALFAGFIGIPGVYAIGFVLAMIALLSVWYAVPKVVAAARVGVDWWGALILAAGAGALLLLFSQLHSASVLTMVLVSVGSTVLIAAWVIRSLRITYPLIDLRLAATPAVSLAHIAMLLLACGGYILLPLVILAGQDERAAGLPVALVGFLFVPYSLMAVLGGSLGNRLRGRVSLLTILMVGACFYAAACVVLAFWHGSTWALVIGMMVGGLGSGSTMAVVPQLIVKQVPGHATSSALSFNTLLRYLGLSLGSALVPVLVAVGDRLGDSYTVAFFVAAGIYLACAALVVVWPGVRHSRA